MGVSPRILLCTTDLMAASRIDGLARAVGASLETVREPKAAAHGGPFDVVLLDLQSFSDEAGSVVGQARAMLEGLEAQVGVQAKLIAFGPHVHRHRLEEARAAGADLAVSRGELLGAFAGLVAPESS